MLSARPRSEYEAQALAAGCVKYLEKPVGPVEVLREVERLIGRPTQSDEGRPPQLGGEEVAA